MPPVEGTTRTPGIGGRPASITADTVGWHDTVGGCSDAKLVAEKYGEKTYQTVRNDFHRNGRECFLEVRASNQSAYRLYERYGFNEVGRRRDYYPAVGGREDALVMACTLLD